MEWAVEECMKFKNAGILNADLLQKTAEKHRVNHYELAKIMVNRS